MEKIGNCGSKGNTACFFKKLNIVYNRCLFWHDLQSDLLYNGSIKTETTIENILK